MHGPFRYLAGACLLAVGVIGEVQSAHAQLGGEQLVVDARCNACHQVSEPLLGPPYIAIAARHAGRKEVMTDVLARKIVYGGGGTWGVVPMVPNQWVSMEQARVMAEWILSLSPSEP
jgi:cytochrome c